jgi:hypothetical protein
MYPLLTFTLSELRHLICILGPDGIYKIDPEKYAIWHQMIS